MPDAAAATIDPNRMEIDLDAIRHNAAEIRRAAGSRRRIVAALKADGYGHGAVEAARVLSAGAADYLGVGSVPEARSMRDAGITAPLVLLGSFLPEMAAEIVRLQVIGSVDSRDTALALAAAAPSPVPVMVKVDCGFGRFGIALPDAAQLIRFVVGEKRLRLEGLYTHLPFSDAAGRDWAERQGRAFEALVEALAAEAIRPPLTQAIASPGLMTGLKDGLNGVAAGHLLFGLNPVGPELLPAAGAVTVKPALTAIRTKLIHVGRALAGEAAAGYLRKQSGPVGVVPIGIHHGYRPRLGEAHMLIAGRRASLLRVCLENTIIDLGGVGPAPVGTEVTLLGADGGEVITLDTLALWQGVSALSLMVSLGRSLPRRYGEAA